MIGSHDDMEIYKSHYAAKTATVTCKDFNTLNHNLRTAYRCAIKIFASELSIDHFIILSSRPHDYQLQNYSSGRTQRDRVSKT